MKLTSVIPLSLALAFAGLAPAAIPAPAAAGIPLLHSGPKDDKAAPLVDLNSATKAELVKLPGLGDTAADRIIAGRPWRSKYDLVLKKVVTRGNYDKFSKLVVARQVETK